MRVFFNDETICEGRSRNIKRAIRFHKKNDPHLKYKFSGPFSELEIALYDLRSGNIRWFQDNNTLDIQRQAIQIEERRLTK